MGVEKIDNKNKFYFGFKYDLSCKVVMEPKNDDVKTTLPLWGGSIATALALAITYTLIFALKTSATTKFFFLVSSLFYFFIVFLHFLKIITLWNVLLFDVTVSFENRRCQGFNNQ